MILLTANTVTGQDGSEYLETTLLYSLLVSVIQIDRTRHRKMVRVQGYPD